MSDETALAVVDAHYVENVPQQPPALFGTEDPVEIIEKATRVANALKAVMVQKGLVMKIQGKEYPLVEAWQMCAAMLNLTPLCEWSRPVDKGWEARVVVQNRQGRTVAAAEAQCLTTEKTWGSRDDFARRSMAQTRATGKALRLALGFIMTLAGYEATPAEEMPDLKPAADKPAASVDDLQTLNQRALQLAYDLGVLEPPQKSFDLRKWLVPQLEGADKATVAKAWSEASMRIAIAFLEDLTIKAHEAAIAAESAMTEPAPDDEPQQTLLPPDPAPTEKKPTPAQQRTYRGLLADLGIEDEKQRLNLNRMIAGKEHTGEMTRDEMSKVIDHLMRRNENRTA